MPTTTYLFDIRGGNAIQTLFFSIGEAAAASARKVDDAGKKASAGLKALDATAKELRGSVNGLVQTLGPLGNVLTSLGPSGVAVAGLAGLAAGIAVLTRRAIENADALNDQAQQVGINVERLQELKFAFGQVGVRDEQTTGFLQKFTVNLGKAEAGSGELLKRLEGLDKGLAATIRSGVGTERAFDLITSKVAGLKSETEQAALLQASFGKGAIALLPALKGGADGFAALAKEARNSGVVIEERLIAAADTAGDRLDQLERTVQANADRMLLELAPSLETITVKLTNATIEAFNLGEALAVALGSKPSPQFRVKQIDDTIAELKAGLRNNILPGLNPVGQGNGIMELFGFASSGGEAAAAKDAAKQRVRELLDERRDVNAEIKKETDEVRRQGEERRAQQRAEAEALRAQREADAAAKKAKEDAASAAKREASERKKMVDEVAEAERRAQVAGLDGIAKVEAARDVALEKFKAEYGERKDFAESFARFEVAVNKQAAAEIADIQEKADEKARKEADKLAKERQDALEKQVQEQQRFLADVGQEVSGFLSDSLIAAFDTGKGAAADWAETVLGYVKRIGAEFAEALLFQGVVGPLLGVDVSQQQSRGGIGTGLVSALVGAVGGGGGVTGLATEALGTATGTTSGNSSLLGSLLTRIAGGGGGGTAVPNTLGTPTLLSRALGLFGGGATGLVAPLATTFATAGSGATALAQGAVLANTGFIPGVGAGGLLAPGGVPATNALPGAASSGAGLVAAYAGLAISLGLAAKGLIDDRETLDRVTLGTANSTKNTLTGLGAGLVAGGAAGGAAIGTAVYPGIGTVIGAGVGAAVGSALSQAINAGVAKGTAEGVRGGLDQAGLNKAIADKLSDDIILNILSGGANAAFVADVLGPAVAPSIERIFAKVFRQAVGGPGGLDTSGVTGGGFYGLGANRDQATRAVRIIAESFGAGGDAFGTERGNNFVSILLGGIRKRLRKEGLGDEAAVQEIAEVFATTFNGRVLNAFAAAMKRPKRDRADELRFVAEQFALGSPAFGFNYQRVADDILEGGRVPGRPARKRSRELYDDAFQAAVRAPADPFAFQRAITGGYTGFAAEQLAKSLSNSSLGIGFADIFAPDQDERRDLRRAKRGKGTENEFDVLIRQFAENTTELANVLKDPAYANGIAAFTDEIFKLGVKVAEATGDVLGARVQIEGRLSPYTGALEAITQTRTDIRSRVGFALAGPGFAGQRAQIEELERVRREREEDLARDRQAFTGITDLRRQQPGEEGASLIQGSLRQVAAFGFIPKDLRAQAFQEIQAFAQARLAELEAEVSLQRELVQVLEQANDQAHGLVGNVQQVVGVFDSRAEASRQFGRAGSETAAARALGFADPVSLQRSLAAIQNGIAASGARFQFFQGASQGFTETADQLSLQTGGRRAARRILADRRAQLDAALPIALAGGAGAEKAIGDLQRLIPQTLEIARGVLSPGQLRRLTRQLEDQARTLGVATGGEADIARDQLLALEKLAHEVEGGTGTALGDANVKLEALKGELVQFRKDVEPVLDYLRGAATETLADQLRQIAVLLGDSGSLGVLRAIAAKFQIPGYALGSPMLAPGDVAVIGERGPELFVTPRAGRVVPVSRRAATTTVQIGGNGPLVVIHQQLPPGTTPAEAGMFARSSVSAAEAEFRAMMKRIA